MQTRSRRRHELAANSKSLGDAAAFPGLPLDRGGDNEGLVGPIVPFGGGYASGKGGYIDAYRQTADPSTNGEQVSLDVAHWAVRKTFEWSPLACSGNLGATDFRLTGYNYRWRAEILWDYRRPADTMKALRNFQYGLEMVFWLGEILNLQRLAAESDGNTVVYPFLWCPDAVLSASDTMLDAISKKMTRVPCEGVARSHFFTCPAEGTITDPSTVAGAYDSWWLNFGPENTNHA